MKPAISVRNLGKQYKLGLVHTNLLSEKMGNSLRAISSRFRKGRGSSHTATQLSGNEYFWALQDINFEIQPGEVMGVIGRNGAGKSTLLKILSRITSPTTGEIHLKGRAASLLEVGTGFHPELTGRENIFLNGAILGMTRKEINKKFDEIVAFAEVDKFIDTPVKRYSSGMYVRLAFSVAAHLEPDILVVDEVLAVGDLAFQKKCINKMEDVSGEGRTILFVSHNMASIKRLCQSALLLEEGCVAMLGGTQEVISRYYESSQSSGLEIKFEASDHRTTSALQVLSLSIVKDRSDGNTAVYQDDTIKVRLHITSRKAFESVRIGIEIYREGVLVTSLHSPPNAISESKDSIFVDCLLPEGALLPGFYDLHVGAMDLSNGRGLDWIPDAFTLHVLDVPSNADAHHDEREKGMVRIPATWSVRP